MTTVQICCEGPACNLGRSAEDRERAVAAQLPAVTWELRDDAMRQARQTVSRQLAVTAHERAGVNRRGLALFACLDCGYERAYGSTFAAL